LYWLGTSFELTTMAGRRLRESILEILKNAGIDNLVLATYANAYSDMLQQKKNMIYSIMKVRPLILVPTL